MKTAISIPDELFEAADRVAKRLGLSRSELYQKAIANYLENQHDAAIKADLNRIYESKQKSQIDPVLGSLQQASIARDDWS